MKAVIFDFDLTLVDSIYAITRGLNIMADHFGLPQVEQEDTRRVMSLETKAFWEALWGKYDPAWNDFFLSSVAGLEKQHLRLFDGARPLVENLKKAGFSLALATNRTHAWQALASVNLAPYFDTAVGATDVEHGKPAPDMIQLVLQQLRADPAQTVFIGDAVYDMRAACAAGIRAVGILEGRGATFQQLMEAGAWQVRPSLRDIDDLLGLG